jgi:cytidylate kinase
VDVASPPGAAHAIPCNDVFVSELLIITGPPGAGKSTVARSVVERFDPSALVQGDVFFGFVAGGSVDPWLPESHEQNTVVTEATARATAAFTKAASPRSSTAWSAHGSCQPSWS